MKRDKTRHQALAGARTKQSSELYGPILEKLKESVRNAVKPIFKNRNWIGPLDLIGSGVLIRFGGHLFLVTAAHVLEHFDGYEVHMPVDGQVMGVKGSSFRSKRPVSGTHDDDPIDAAVLRVDDGEIKQSLLKDALSLEQTIWMQSNVLTAGLAIVGHPRWSFTRRGDIVDTNLIVVSFDGEPETTYRRIGLHPRDHIIMGRKKKVLSSAGVTRTRSLRGMSGGGLWRIPRLCPAPWPAGRPLADPRLVGIFIEWRKGDGLLISTNIWWHVLLMAAPHSDLQSLMDEELTRSQKEWDEYYRDYRG